MGQGSIRSLPGFKCDFSLFHRFGSSISLTLSTNSLNFLVSCTLRPPAIHNPRKPNLGSRLRTKLQSLLGLGSTRHRPGLYRPASIDDVCPRCEVPG